MNRHCDPVTMDHIIELRKRVALLEKQLENTLSWVTPLRRENERLQNTSHLLYEAGLKKDNEIENLRDEVHFDNQTIESLHDIKDRFQKENEQLREALQYAVDQYGKPGGPWNVPGSKGSWIDQAKKALNYKEK